MRISLVIASHNEGQNLARTVQSCLETADGLDTEIVVADDASTDGSLSELRRFPKVRVVARQERLGVSPTKDLAARSSRGEVLVFLDGHCKPEPGSIARMVADVEATGGRAIITPASSALDTNLWENNPYQVGHGYRIDLEKFGCGWTGLDQLRPSPERPWLAECPALIGCALAISRPTYERLRGFDPDMRVWGVEDIDFGLKAWLMGHPILHDRQAVVGHRFRASFDNYSVPAEHPLANQLRMARKNFTEPVWAEWLEMARRREQSWLWDLAWSAFEERRESVEEERDYLMANRVHDEFWYADRFGLNWPQAPRPIQARSASFAQPEDDDDFDDPRELFLDHYRNPRNRRLLVAPDAEGTAHAANGAVLTVYLSFDVDDFDETRIADACFQSQRCGVAVAYASLLTERLPGMTLDEAAVIPPESLMSRFGEGAVAGASAGLAVTALRKAIARSPTGQLHS